MQNNHVSSLLNQFLDDFYYRREHPNEIRGLPSGLNLLDRTVDGFKPGEVILIGGRPGMGKTFFSINLMHHIASYFQDQHQQNNADDKCVLYFNLGMSNIDFIRRLIAVDSGLSSSVIKTQSNLTDVEESIKKSALHISSMPIYISNTEDISDEIQKTSTHKQIGCVIINCLQLMVSSQFPEEDYTDTICQMKKLATQLNIPIIILTQLSRELEERDCKIPLCCDIRGYNKKQVHADKILFLYREFYYLQNNKPKRSLDETLEQFALRVADWERRKTETQNQCDIIIAKNNTPCHIVRKFTFSQENGTFKDYDDTI